MYDYIVKRTVPSLSIVAHHCFYYLFKSSSYSVFPRALTTNQTRLCPVKLDRNYDKDSLTLILCLFGQLAEQIKLFTPLAYAPWFRAVT
jgi:hypothetical protein